MPTGDYPMIKMYDTCTSDTDNTDIILTTNDFWWNYTPARQGIITNITESKNNKKGDDDMRYLYEVILVNPKNDDFRIDQVIARSETSALMKAYNESQFSIENNVPFDDLKTSYRILMEWKKEKSLKKAIETIKKAVE